MSARSGTTRKPTVVDRAATLIRPKETYRPTRWDVACRYTVGSFIAAGAAFAAVNLSASGASAVEDTSWHSSYVAEPVENITAEDSLDSVEPPVEATQVAGASISTVSADVSSGASGDAFPEGIPITSDTVPLDNDGIPISFSDQPQPPALTADDRLIASPYDQWLADYRPPPVVVEAPVPTSQAEPNGVPQVAPELSAQIERIRLESQATGDFLMDAPAVLNSLPGDRNAPVPADAALSGRTSDVPTLPVGQQPISMEQGQKLLDDQLRLTPVPPKSEPAPSDLGVAVPMEFGVEGELVLFGQGLRGQVGSDGASASVISGVGVGGHASVKPTEEVPQSGMTIEQRTAAQAGPVKVNVTTTIDPVTLESTNTSTSVGVGAGRASVNVDPAAPTGGVTGGAGLSPSLGIGVSNYGSQVDTWSMRWRDVLAIPSATRSRD